MTPVEHDELWQQFGTIVRTISAVQNHHFGLPHVGPCYPSWSATYMDWLERTIEDAERCELNTFSLRQLLSIVRVNTATLDQIAHPCLLHGDLWTFNLLIERQQGEMGARIVGVLDADRASWGDPLADWTFYLLPRRASTQEQALFWRAYGEPDGRAPNDEGSRFRVLAYEGLHQGKILSAATRDRKPRAVERAYTALERVNQELRVLLAVPTPLRAR